MEVYNSSRTAAELEYALSAVPSIGKNGNWFIGGEDTGIYAGGVKVTDAEVGQLVKIAAVDENGIPTAWEPAYVWGKAWRLLRSFDLPDDPSTDTSGITWYMCTTEGYTEQISKFEFSTDEGGANFAVRELFVVMNTGYGLSENYFGLGDQKCVSGLGYGNLFCNRSTMGNKKTLTKMTLYVRSVGPNTQGLLTLADNYSGGAVGNRQIRSDEDITAVCYGTFLNSSILPGSSFEIWGR